MVKLRDSLKSGALGRAVVGNLKLGFVDFEFGEKRRNVLTSHFAQRWFTAENPQELCGRKLLYVICITYRE